MDKQRDALVIGSGPAGIACALALLDSGVTVTMLDPGETLEPGIQRKIDRLRTAPPESWDPKALAEITQPPRMDGSGLAAKLVFGSDYPYARQLGDRFEQVGTHCLQSRAQGGLSTVWGAAVLPFRAEDLQGWPLSASELAPGYDALSRHVPIAAPSAADDPLRELLPRPVQTLPPMKPSPAARQIAVGWNAHRTELARKGVNFGPSRLAVTTAPEDHPRLCRNAGICLTGCPDSAIYSSAQTLEQLIRREGFEYVPGQRVRRISENRPGRTVEVHTDTTTFHAFRVFVGAGVLSTLEIVRDSLPPGGRMSTRFASNPYFILPLVSLRDLGAPGKVRAHSLAQLFIEILDPAISASTVHLQLYTYSDPLRQELVRRLGFLGPLRNAVASLLLRRLIFIQGYLHSDEGPQVNVELGADSQTKIRLSAEPHPATAGKIRKIGRKLLGLWRCTGLIPLLPMLHIGKPGEGNHIGGSFPMRVRPGPLETDTRGVLHGFERVHLVDASVLPSLPATTLTFSAMANSWRIGRLAGEEIRKEKSPA